MDQRFIDLYNVYVHGGMNRRAFIERLAALAGSTAAAYALLPLLENDMAKAQTIAETDPRITVQEVTVPGVNGLRGHLARPRAAGKYPAVLVIHENRGLNPHIKDVARRFGAAGFLALGLDYLSPMGGTPDDTDKAAAMFPTLQADQVLASGRAAVAYLAAHPNSNGKVGAVGYCWGGGQVNNLAVNVPDLDAGVAYYGAQQPVDRVAAIRAPLMFQYAAMDERINAGIPGYEAALKAAGKRYESYTYPGTNHGFNNDTNAARYNKEAADLAWGRTVDWFKKNLA